MFCRNKTRPLRQNSIDTVQVHGVITKRILRSVGRYKISALHCGQSKQNHSIAQVLRRDDATLTRR